MQLVRLLSPGPLFSFHLSFLQLGSTVVDKKSAIHARNNCVFLLFYVQTEKTRKESLRQWMLRKKTLREYA